jgi:hypothetical protein
MLTTTHHVHQNSCSRGSFLCTDLILANGRGIKELEWRGGGVMLAEGFNQDGTKARREKNIIFAF